MAQFIIEVNEVLGNHILLNISGKSVRITADTLVDVGDAMNNGVRFCAIYVGEEPYMIHQRKFEAGRPHLMELVLNKLDRINKAIETLQDFNNKI